VDLDLVLAVGVGDISALTRHGWERDPRQQQRWKAPSGALLDLLPAPREVQDLKDLAHILNEYPPIRDDRLYSDEVFERNLDTSQAQAFVLGRELGEVCAEPDRQIVTTFLAMTDEEPHFSRFVNQSPWRHDEEQLKRRLAALRDGFAPPT